MRSRSWEGFKYTQYFHSIKKSRNGIDISFRKLIFWPRFSFLVVDDLALSRALTGADWLVVLPGERKRFPDALLPGLNVIVYVIGPPEYVHRSTKDKIKATDEFQVNNYANKTFLRGKQLTISKTGDYNIKPVRFFHGIWRIKRIDSKGVMHEYELNLSHVKPHCSGSITYKNTGEKTLMSGTMGDQTMTFKIRTPTYAGPDDLRFETSELRIYPNGLCEGYFNASYVEEGQRQKLSMPVRFEVDFLKKELIFRKYED